MELIDTIEEFKLKRPDLVEDFEKMTKEELLEQIYKECLDASNMEERVQLFMNKCTSLSKTTYTLEIIETLINDYKESLISEWCWMTIEDAKDMDNPDEYIVEEVIKESEKYK